MTYRQKTVPLCLILAVSMAGIGCDDQKKAEADEAETASKAPSGGEGAAAASKQKIEAASKSGDGVACGPKTVPFAGGAAGSGRIAYAISKGETGRQQKIAKGGVGVVSLDEAGWVHHELTADALERDLSLSANGRYLAYQLEEQAGPQKAVSIEVVDLQSGTREEYSYGDAFANPRLYGVTDDGRPAATYGVTGDFEGTKNFERRTGLFGPDGELEPWAKSLHRYQDLTGGAMSADGSTIAIITKRDRQMVVQVLRAGSEPETVYEVGDEWTMRPDRSPELSSDGARLVLEIHPKRPGGDSPQSLTVAIDTSSKKVVEHPNLQRPHISPDGARLVGIDRDEKLSGFQFAAVVRAFDSPKNQKTLDASYKPLAWSPDGRRFLAELGAYEDARLVSYDLDAGKATPVASCHFYAAREHFAPVWAKSP